MRILIDPEAGFCMGVRRAIERITEELKTHRYIHIQGELIHNSGEMSRLSKLGLITHSEDEPLPPDSITAVRTHGVPYASYKSLVSTQKKIVNLVCPHVTRIQSIIKKHSSKGESVIITGYSSHPEVESLTSYAKEAIVISTFEQALKITPTLPTLLVSQTTFDQELFLRIKEHLKSRFADQISIYDTICDATHKRQSSLKTLLKNSPDLCIVVGGYNSSNTKRLADISRRMQVKTVHIERADELKSELLSSLHKESTVLLTAGASTPQWLIEDVTRRLMEVDSLLG